MILCSAGDYSLQAKYLLTLGVGSLRLLVFRVMGWEMGTGPMVVVFRVL